MDAMRWFFWPFIVPVVAIVGVFAYKIVQTMMQARVRELEIRERIAMIERGLVPPPEVDPRGFERAMSRYERMSTIRDMRGSTSSGRHRRAGITLIGVGLGLMLLISVAGETPTAGVGVGGFLAVLGAAFLVNSFFEMQQAPPSASMPGSNGTVNTPPPPASPSEPSAHS